MSTFLCTFPCRCWILLKATDISTCTITLHQGDTLYPYPIITNGSQSQYHTITPAVADNVVEARMMRSTCCSPAPTGRGCSRQAWGSRGSGARNPGKRRRHSKPPARYHHQGPINQSINHSTAFHHCQRPTILLPTHRVGLVRVEERQVHRVHERVVPGSRTPHHDTYPSALNELPC